MTPMLVLGIESSCDETAAAVVRDGRFVESSVVSSQIDLHAAYGGVVPELAGRAHLERIVPVAKEALFRAGIEPETDRAASTLSAVAATVGPGLVGSLLVGLCFAKSLAVSWKIPFVAVNHLEGHLFASLLEEESLEFPVVVLLVSGGHTLLVSMTGVGEYEILGETVDDAAGEAFDKVARFLGLSYPGGPALERAARSGDPTAVLLPRPMLGAGLDFSFSGLKTAVVRAVGANEELSTEDVAASFQQAVVDVLVAKALAGAEANGAVGICLAGGVGANGPLRAALTLAGEKAGLSVHLPSRAMCTDNAAMIAAAGTSRLLRLGPSRLDVGPRPSWRLGAKD